MKLFRFLIFLAVIFQTAIAQTWQDTLAIIDRTFSQYQSVNPGCQLSVSRNSELIFSKAWGMADLERKTSLANESIIEAGSVSKQFTAAAILLLEQQGKLSLDDDVRKFVPEIPDYGNKITLRHMMHHTSGLKDWGAVAALSGWGRGTKFYTNDDALEIIARQKSLNNKPGDEYIYSNSGYNLFAIIVQRVSGLSLAAFTRQYIFEPAGMKHTQWRDDPGRIVINRAIAYEKTMTTGYSIEMPNEYVYGNGGLLTTTEDLIRWSVYYQAGKLGQPSLLAKQLQTDPFNNGEIHTYAAGLNVRPVMGWKNISHGGATAGYRAYLETFPELNLTIAVLSNTSQYDIGSIAGKVRKIFVTDKSERNIKTEAAIALSAKELNAMAGLYKNERDNTTFELKIKNNAVVLDNSGPLRASSSNSLSGENFLLKINDNSGQIIQHSPRDTIAITRVLPVKMAEINMSDYEGQYYSEETQSYVKVTRQKNSLMIIFKPGASYPLIPNYKDAFKIIPFAGIVEFERKGNSVEKMKISISRARNVSFQKIK